MVPSGERKREKEKRKRERKRFPFPLNPYPFTKERELREKKERERESTRIWGKTQLEMCTRCVQTLRREGRGKLYLLFSAYNTAYIFILKQPYAGYIM